MYAAAKVQRARVIQTTNRCNALPPSTTFDSTYESASDPNWQNAGFTVEKIGGSSTGGRIVAWGDEWLTYNTLWSASGQDTYDIDATTGQLVAQCNPLPPYQVAAFWENVIAWLAVNDPDATKNNY